MATSQNLGMSIGTALLGAMLLAGLASGAALMIEESPVIPGDLKSEIIAAVEDGVQFVSDEELNAVLEGAPPDIAEEILRINRLARIQGIRVSLWAAVIVAIFGLLASLFLPRQKLITGEG